MFISSKIFHKTDSLDEIRLNKGIDKMREIFSDLIKSNRENAIKLINDTNLKFTSLYILRHEIKEFDIQLDLSLRNRHALNIADGILFSSDYKQEYYPVLKWILETGYKEDGLNDQFDDLLDTSAIILAKVYKDRDCLPIIEEMIFNRHRKGAFTYDLIWAFFETANSENLIMLANRLRSSNPKDTELACKFLSFIPCISMNDERDSTKQYLCSVEWIKENRDFLFYTGETCLQTSNPNRYSVSLEAKYLQKTVSFVNGELSRNLTEYEFTCLDSFKKLDDYSKLCLSNYSHMLYRKSKKKWSKWLQNPIDKQIEVAREDNGGSI